MDFFQAFIFSIVEGVSEFLPISSTGHLVLTAKLLNIPQTDFVKSFEIIIQLGAILAVVFLYWKTIWGNKKTWRPIAAAFIPTAIVGLVLYKFIKSYLIGNEFVTLWALAIGGVIMIGVEYWFGKKNLEVSEIEKITTKNAILIGIFQTLSIVPGVSRAAATIIGAMIVGTKRKTAVEFSFLLAIPTMAAATGLDLLKTNLSFTGQEWGVLSIGFIGSFVFAMIAVKFLIRFVKHHTFIPFGIYRIILAILFFLFILK